MRLPFALLLVLGLTGCAGSPACRVFSPTPAVSPSAQENQRVEVQSTGDPTAPKTRADAQAGC